MKNGQFQTAEAEHQGLCACHPCVSVTFYVAAPHMVFMILVLKFHNCKDSTIIKPLSKVLGAQMPFLNQQNCCCLENCRNGLFQAPCPAAEFRTTILTKPIGGSDAR